MLAGHVKSCRELCFKTQVSLWNVSVLSATKGHFTKSYFSTSTYLQFSVAQLNLWAITHVKDFAISRRVDK